MLSIKLYVIIFFLGFFIPNSIYASLHNNVEINKNVVSCSEQDILQDCLDKAKGQILTLLPGNYKSYMANIHSDTTVIIPRGVIIKLADDALMPLRGGHVLGIRGTEDKYANNVHIVLNGIIDGNNKAHPYEKSGNEGVTYGWVKNCSITGNGIIKNASGDGIDVDAVEDCYFEGVQVINNSGSGFHFGSPRPIKGSKNNIVMNIYARGNGFKVKRNGLDLSWANPNGATFVNNKAVDNYRNYEITAEGGVIVGSLSIDNGRVVKKDNFEGADFAQVNGIDVTNKSWISKKHRILIKRDIKKFLNLFFNFKTHDYLDPINY